MTRYSIHFQRVPAEYHDFPLAFFPGPLHARASPHNIETRRSAGCSLYSYAFSEEMRGSSSDVANVEFHFNASEIVSQLENTKFVNGASHFFYTNDNDVVNKMSKVNGTKAASRWNMKLMDVGTVKEFCDQSTIKRGRVMTKYLKFKKLPNELLDFDYVVHKDASSLSGPYFKTSMPTMHALQKEVQRSPKACLFALEHPQRKTVREELQVVIHRKFENTTSADRWEAHLRDINFHDSWPLVHLGHFIRKVGCSKVQDAFSAVFDTLVQYDLNRDQIVFGVVAPGYLRLGEDVIIKPRACPEWGKFCTATTTNISQKTF